MTSVIDIVIDKEEVEESHIMIVVNDKVTRKPLTRKNAARLLCKLVEFLLIEVKK